MHEGLGKEIDNNCEYLDLFETKVTLKAYTYTRLNYRKKEKENIAFYLVSQLPSCIK